MNIDHVKRIADTVLYEGYILYPYRSTAVKNQQRFNFGIVAPPASGETSRMRTECLIEGKFPQIDVCVRCLHLLSQEVSQARVRKDEEDKCDFEPVVSLSIDGHLHQTWQEVVEREFVVESLPLTELVERAHQDQFAFPSIRDKRTILDENSRPAGIVVRSQEAVHGRVTVRAESRQRELWKVCVEIENTTILPNPSANASELPTATQNAHERFPSQRNESLIRSLVSTHTLLQVHGGQFVSLIDPDEEWAESAVKCNNVGTWPVLVGSKGNRNIMLSSPIILYDYPEIAPESDGDFYDGLEIDEMLALRVMTLTDEEKREMRDVDPRARQILERTEALLPLEMQKLHGIIRHLKPSKTS